MDYSEHITMLPFEFLCLYLYDLFDILLKLAAPSMSHVQADFSSACCNLVHCLAMKHDPYAAQLRLSALGWYNGECQVSGLGINYLKGECKATLVSCTGADSLTNLRNRTGQEPDGAADGTGQASNTATDGTEQASNTATDGTGQASNTATDGTGQASKS